MRRIIILLVALLVITATTTNALAQDPSASQLAEAEKAFETANALMEQGEHAEALTHYKKALAILPKEPAFLFNGGLAAYGSKDYLLAADLWTQLKVVDPTDWHVRAKLIQAYQALSKLSDRDVQRAELFEMWKKGNPAELKEHFEYCRDQFEVNGKKVMAFEHFELKGNRALRYVFRILNEAEDDEDFRISLGSYDMTNAIWRERQNPKPKEGERLFHLDGYFKGGGHATYSMLFPEPSYDDVRGMVIKILEGKGKPVSSTTVVPATPKPETKPTP